MMRDEHMSETTDAWTFALAGIIATVAFPIFSAITPYWGRLFVPLCFGAALGALDTRGDKSGPRAFVDYLLAVVLGVLLGVAVLGFESALLSGLVLGCGAATTRWESWRGSPQPLCWAALIGGGGAMIVDLLVPSSIFLASFSAVAPFMWGILAGLSILPLEDGRWRTEGGGRKSIPIGQLKNDHGADSAGCRFGARHDV